MGAGDVAAQAAEAEWRKRVGPRSPLVKEYRLGGVGWAAPEWCGAFAAWCWQAAGLRPDVARLWASTYKLVDLYGRYRLDTNIPYPNVVVSEGKLYSMKDWQAQHGGLRWCERGGLPLKDVLPGDVMTVGLGKRGTHIVLVQRVLEDGSGVRTISGNGAGWWPGADGQPDESQKRYGVVVTDYLWGQVAWRVRPAPADLDRGMDLRSKG
jgi:hypothetical protein